MLGPLVPQRFVVSAYDEYVLEAPIMRLGAKDCFVPLEALDAAHEKGVLLRDLKTAT